LVIVNNTTNTVVNEILELKCCSTNSENALNVIPENGSSLGAAETTGRSPTKSTKDHGKASKFWKV
jgi:hypothetical protein